MPGIENLDKDKNQQVDLLEIQEALKPNGFLDSKNKNFEDNMSKIKQDLQKNSYEPQKEYLKITLTTALSNAKFTLQEKIKQNTPLTGEEIKILKLALFLESPSYYKVDFNGTDWKKDTSLSLWISTINPVYQNTKSLDGIKKSVDHLTSTESIVENKEVLEATLGNAKEILVSFCQTLQQTMTGASDYTFYHNFMYDVQEFLKGHQTNQCANYADYQAQIQEIAKFFTSSIKSNGKLDSSNPAYAYIKNQSAFQSVSTDAFVNVGNILTTLSKAKTQGDVENIKGKAYTNIREMLGGQLYLMGKRGYLGSFNTSEHMGKLEEEIINAEAMQKYPELKIIAEFLKDLKKESGSKQTLGLDTQYQKLIHRLDGKVPTKFILFLQQKFEDQKEDMQKEINTVYSDASTDAVQSLAIMNVLGEQQQRIQLQFSKEELVLAAKSYKETGTFTKSVMVRLEAFGISSSQITTQIENKARELRVQQYNQMISARLRSFTLENALDANPSRAESLGKNNQLFKLYNDIKGVGNEGGHSDAGIQKWKSMSEQILISIAVIAFSGGIGSLAAGATLGGIEAATVGGRILLFAAKMIVEGTVFHAVNTLTTGAISGDLNAMLHELKSPKAWAKSVLYMGVMNGVGKALNIGIMKAGSPLLKKGVDLKYFMQLSKGLQVPTEIAGMMATDQIVSLTFDQRLQDITMEGMMQTITLVIGLKAAHKIVPMTPSQGAITSDEVQITSLTKNEGIITDIGYKQKIMNTIDAKVDYLARLCKIKSGIRANVAVNILNSIDSDFAKSPGKNHEKALEEVKNTIEQLRQEGKSPDDLEKKYKEIQEKTVGEKTHTTFDIATVNNEKESVSMLDLRNVGPDKPLGYLPLSTIKTIGKDVNVLVAEFKAKGLNTIILDKGEGATAEGSLYVYDEIALSKLLSYYKPVLESYGWATSPEAFIKKLKDTAPQKTELFTIIADTFNDKTNIGRMDVIQTDITEKDIHTYTLLEPTIKELGIISHGSSREILTLVNNLDKETIAKLQKLKPKLNERGLAIRPNNLAYISRFSEIDIEKLSLVKSLGMDVNFIIYDSDIIYGEDIPSLRFMNIPKELIQYAVDQKVSVENLDDIEKLWASRQEGKLPKDLEEKYIEIKENMIDAAMKGKKENNNSKPNPEIARANADLPDLPRLQTAEQLLKEAAGSLVDREGNAPEKTGGEEKNNKILGKDKNLIDESIVTEKINDFLQRHENGDTKKYLGDLKKTYNDNLPRDIKQKFENGEKLTTKEIQTQQAYDIRFKTTVEYMSTDGNKVKFRDATGEWQNTNINEYGKNLLSSEIYTTPEGQILFNKIKEFMFYQTLDNPLQFCSHGFDHSILVDEYVKNISNGTDVVNKTMEKYDISPEAAKLLLRLTAVFHDFGYPEVGNLDKSTHGIFGGVLFMNEISSDFKNLLTKQFGVSPAKVGEIALDMRDAIFFHSADKVEQGYLNKVKFTKGEVLVGQEVFGEGSILKDMIQSVGTTGDKIIIYYRKGNMQAYENAKSFKNKLVELDMEDKIKDLDIDIQEDVVSTNYDISHGTDIYQGRKSKSITDLGIEFKPIDLYESPLSGVVRLADNFDMSLNRLTELQKGPVFMDLMYNLGMTKLGPNASSTIFQSIEKVSKMEPSTNKTQSIETLKQQIINNGIEIMINDNNNGNIKETQMVKLNEIETHALFKPDGNIDINAYKVYIVDQLAKIHNVTDVGLLQGVKNVALENKTDSYSFRHFVGLTPIKDVTLLKTVDMNDKERTVIKVIVDEKIYNNSALKDQYVRENGKEIRLNDYHIWRLYDASARVTVDKSLLQVEIYNQNGVNIGMTSRASAESEFIIERTQ